MLIKKAVIPMLKLKKNYIINLLFIISFLLAFKPAFAGGVALGSTRIVYSMEAKQSSISVRNTDEKTRFLVQSWVENKEGNKTNDIVITPPLFVIEPTKENTLRVILSNPDLPQDRESLYWLNSKAIPAIERAEVDGKNVLQIAILSRIKVFIRPQNLPIQSGDAYSMLKFSKKGPNTLIIENPTPYYITIVNINLGSQKIKGLMVSPKSQETINVKNIGTGTISYQTINDFGANTPIKTVNLN